MTTNKNPNLSDRCFSRIVIMLSDINFSDDITKMRELYNIDIINKQKKFNILDKKNKNFNKDINKLRLKYKLSPVHYSALMWIIIFGTWPSRGSNGFADVKCEIHSNDYGEEILYLPIYPETTIADIENDWGKIKKISERVYKYKYKRQKLYKKLKEDVIIRKMKEWGISHARIAKTYNNIFPNNKTISYDEVAVILNKLKKKAAKEKKIRDIK